MAQPQSFPEETGDERGPLSPVARGVAPKGDEALRRLRGKVAEALGEIERLREENLYLKQQLEALRSAPRPAEHDVLLSLEDDPDELRRTIDEFIEALDRHLSATP